MTPQEFAQAVRGILTYFRKPEPEPALLEAWYELLADAPGGHALEQACRELKSEEDRLPENLPKALLRRLPRTKPRPARTPAGPPCAFCHDKGVVLARKRPADPDAPRTPPSVWRCGLCNRQPPGAMATLTPQTLAQFQLELVP